MNFSVSKKSKNKIIEVVITCTAILVAFFVVGLVQSQRSKRAEKNRQELLSIIEDTPDISSGVSIETDTSRAITLTGESCPKGSPFAVRSTTAVTKEAEKLPDVVPGDLVDVSPVVETRGIAVCLRADAALALFEMVSQARNQGHSIAATSGYRDFQLQTFLRNRSITRHGNLDIDRVARVGHSEHHLGTAVDLTGKTIGYAGSAHAFGDSPEGIWTAENAHTYGFVLSYPEGQEKITGYIYEPWHYRYVGKDLAGAIFESGLTPNEYLLDRFTE